MTKRMVFGASVQGASHVNHNIECQDSYKMAQLSDGSIIIAVADGHGSSSCPYSKSGSKIATNTFVHVLTQLHKSYLKNLDSLSTYLNREGEMKVAQTIDIEWKKRVIKTHLNAKREFPLDEAGKRDKDAVYKMYGTTLLGVLITEKYVFGFQLGDGDIVYVDEFNNESLISGERILGVETHSLSKSQAWKNVITTINRIDEEFTPCLFMLSTDGFSNSHINDIEFKKTCRDYYNLIKEHGVKKIEEHLKVWLSETSVNGCGDDITAVFAYITE